MNQSEAQHQEGQLNPGSKKISKTQLKKQKRKAERRENQKQKKMQKKQEKKQNKKLIQQKLDCEKEELKDNLIKPIKKRDVYKEQMKDAMKVVIDVQFLPSMTDQEKTSLLKQIQLCHSLNYKSNKPLNLVVTSIDEEFMNQIKRENGHNWGINLTNQDYLQLFNKEQLVYLTGDSNEDIEKFDENSIYIIGGLVDHNRLKNITLNKANEQNLKTQRFPINHFMKLKTSSILTVNQVFQIILKQYNGATWQESLEQAIPQRKKQA